MILKDEEQNNRPDASELILINEPGFSALSAFLTHSPFFSETRQGDRRSGQDRRTGDRRITARSFAVSE